MHVKLIKTEADYQQALARVGDLMDAEPERDTPEYDELELLSTLVELYEKEHFPIDLPDAVSAIKFRMEQAGLQPKDLIPFIGSASKVSEVLNGKRELTLRMIRALHNGLGIPADVLLQEKDAELPEELEIDVERLPWGEMVKRGWFQGVENYKVARENAERFIRELMPQPDALRAFYRRSVRQSAEMDQYALTAWTARVVKLAHDLPIKAKYQPGSIDDEFVRDLRAFSFMNEGPRLAREYLANCGIRLVIERHLPKTRVDGAATLLPDGAPVIGLSLRYNRIDYFWFCLFHELAHVHCHLTGGQTQWFIDDLDSDGGDRDAEEEADRWAQDNLISQDEWETVKGARGEEDVHVWARRLRINPAIIAGRIRRDRQDYRLLSRLVGQGELYQHFPEMVRDGS
jgi:HTH-type transcriptional regulator / antitoxin HigA